MAASTTAHVGFHKLVVRDLKRQSDFYRSVAGYGEGSSITAEIAGRAVEELILQDDEGRMLILLSYADQGIDPDPGGVITGFFTPDLDSFAARVRESGGQVVEDITPIELATGPTRYAFFADPEGFVFEALEG